MKSDEKTELEKKLGKARIAGASMCRACDDWLAGNIELDGLKAAIEAKNQAWAEVNDSALQIEVIATVLEKHAVYIGYSAAMRAAEAMYELAEAMYELGARVPGAKTKAELKVYWKE